MAQGVVERFLDDAVDRQPSFWRKPASFSDDLEGGWQSSPVDLIDVALDRGFNSEIVEIGGSQCEDDGVDFVHRSFEQIVDLGEIVRLRLLISVVLNLAAKLQRPSLVERAGDQWGN